MNTPPTIAITGASGLIGRALCGHLARAGFRVIALTREHDENLAAMERVEARRFALPDQFDASTLAGVDVLIHAAYPTMLRDLRAIRRINEDGTHRLLEASRRAGVARFILVSTTSAHEGARSYYGRSKLRLEAALDPMRDLAIRPGLVLAREGGLFSRIRDTIAKSRIVPAFGGGRQLIQTIHVEDLCRGFETAITQGETRRLTLAEPDGLLFRDLIELVARRLGRRIMIIPAPMAPALLAMKCIEKCRVPLPVSSENLLGLMSLRHVECRGDLARLGVHIRTAEESLRDLIA